MSRGLAAMGLASAVLLFPALSAAEEPLHEFTIRSLSLRTTGGGGQAAMNLKDINAGDPKIRVGGAFHDLTPEQEKDIMALVASLWDVKERTLKLEADLSAYEAFSEGFEMHMSVSRCGIGGERFTCSEGEDFELRHVFVTPGEGELDPKFVTVATGLVPYLEPPSASEEVSPDAEETESAAAGASVAKEDKPAKKKSASSGFSALTSQIKSMDGALSEENVKKISEGNQPSSDEAPEEED